MDWWWLFPVIVTLCCIVRVYVIADRESDEAGFGVGVVTIFSMTFYGLITASTWAVFFFLKWVLS